MMSVSEARESAKDIAPSLRGISRDKKLILEGIIIGLNMGKEMEQDENHDQPCKTG